ncbi:MurR/RpiR family transcriptional regulator [Lacticaseibacillus hulanensis]|jgi:DNA-binding MurR/RpiR family transcriptional regulator|uniref:MurR/RpiR family transcriptional regulator n=1 Tax=Lacticaseibacillus hulanensis TaxID=2493111 RepID=UPI000FDB5C68|nr:MurR/RpiR family transcriptional regulator [Lacticaseibacillus hulanensis]
MFPYDKLQTLNELETVTYNYINRHQDEVGKMTIRELASKAHVSTTTILRFANKMGYDGYSELRFALKQYQRNSLRENQPAESYDITVPLADFFNKVNSTDFNKLIDQAIKLINDAPLVLFYGIGSGSSLSEYGARYLSNAGKLALPIGDVFQPFPSGNPLPKNTVIFIMSVSGETKQVIELVTKVQPDPVKIIAVTNHGNSRLAQMSDLVISYYMPELKHGDLNLTTQVPVVYLMELIAHRIEEQRAQ